jgi:hypothetical protein
MMECGPLVEILEDAANMDVNRFVEIIKMCREQVPEGGAV